MIEGARSPILKRILAGEVAVGVFVVVAAVCYITRTWTGVTVVGAFPLGWTLAPNRIQIDRTNRIQVNRVMKELLRVVLPLAAVLYGSAGIWFAFHYPTWILATIVGITVGLTGGFLTRAIVVST